MSIIKYSPNLFEEIKKLVKAWDPDYTKLTDSEKKIIDEALKDKDDLSHEEVWE